MGKTTMNLDEVGKFVSQVGFPIAVAAYLLLRHDRTIRDLTESIHALRETLMTVLSKEK